MGKAMSGHLGLRTYEGIALTMSMDISSRRLSEAAVLSSSTD